MKSQYVPGPSSGGTSEHAQRIASSDPPQNFLELPVDGDDALLRGRVVDLAGSSTRSTPAAVMCSRRPARSSAAPDRIGSVCRERVHDPLQPRVAAQSTRSPRGSARSSPPSQGRVQEGVGCRTVVHHPSFFT
jgi:hypothetical protein